MRLLALFLLVLATPALADDALVPSVWENQSGSMLYLDTIDSEGRMTGRYINGAPGYRCQGIEYPVSAQLFDPLISFRVIWIAEAETCHTITSWTGVIDGDVIETEWSLVRWAPPDSATGEDGFARFAGESRFERSD
ncbi:avidin/streptavidin family protein [Hyphobacterium sp.]|uniref:avidin/streptavidin family protein n=1 Tax=Hyphobacterium sp. TaxID=2004662 RepID=UPI003B517549